MHMPDTGTKYTGTSMILGSDRTVLYHQEVSQGLVPGTSSGLRSCI